MNIMAWGGMVVSFTAILWGNVLEGGTTKSLYVPVAFMIVVVGAYGACMIQFTGEYLKMGWKGLKWVYFGAPVNKVDTIKKIIEWANTARREGLLELESAVEEEENEFAKKGLQMVVDGTDAELIREILEIEMAQKEHKVEMGLKVWEAMGGYAPTFGILGAVCGLIVVMSNLSDPSKLGTGIAVAFVATIYGVGFANGVFLPWANAMKEAGHQIALEEEIILEGLIGISEGDNPRNLEAKLYAYVPGEEPDQAEKG